MMWEWEDSTIAGAKQEVRKRSRWGSAEKARTRIKRVSDVTGRAFPLSRLSHRVVPLHKLAHKKPRHSEVSGLSVGLNHQKGKR